MLYEFAAREGLVLATGCRRAAAIREADGPTEAPAFLASHARRCGIHDSTRWRWAAAQEANDEQDPAAAQAGG